MGVNMNEDKVRASIRQAGSIRGAARLLGVSYTSVQYWLMKNGYEVFKRTSADIRATTRIGDQK